MTQPAIRIVRFPHGLWAGVGALPVQGNLLFAQDVMDERPLLVEAWKRISPSLAPIIQRPPVAAIGAAQHVQTAINAARKTADALASREIRERLMQRVSAKLHALANAAQQGYEAARLSGFSPVEQLHGAVGELICQIDAGNKEALTTAVELAQRHAYDPRAAVFLNELIQHSARGPAGARLIALFNQHGFGGIAKAIEQWQRAAPQSR